MIEKLKKFMQGRYGLDESGMFLLALGVIITLISSFTKNNILYLISLIILVIYAYRIFSKNFKRRYKENALFVLLKDKIIGLFYKIKYNHNQRKIYRIFKCPSCKQKVRVPKGKGNITITCPKCKTEFKKKS